jgi:primosomal protein N'
VLVDVAGYNKHHLAKGKRENDSPRTERHTRRRTAEAKGEAKTEPKTRSFRVTEEEARRNKESMLAQEEDLCFVSELVGGYALKNKEWVQFYVEDLEPMVWNEDAYSHLVYDEQQKDLVLSFVENHNAKNKASGSQDVIIGKGQGLIILLSGPPGTGKTLTAEAVADRTRRPLFYLQAEDLGVNPGQLGAKIKRVFEMATEWDAVILLDEADVFMAERNPNDVHRNELVSIFLRELEYFRGIIFLTTNLYSTIDSAFRSRVSLHLLFQQLSRGARESVWRKFLERLPETRPRRVTAQGDDGPVVDQTDGSKAQGGEAVKEAGETDRPIDDEDLAQLSLWQLNGREIKNAVKMVHSWCCHKGYVLTLDRLESGIRVTTPHASKDGDVDEGLYD